MRITRIILRRIEVPLAIPYVVSTRTIHAFDPLVVEVRDDEDRIGFGEAMIAPGYTSETFEGAWRLASELSAHGAGRPLDGLRSLAMGRVAQSPGAVSAILSALDMLAADPLLAVEEDTRVPLLAPFQAKEPERYREHAQSLLERGFRTIKLKVGFDWQQDLHRVEAILKVLEGRAAIRLDANRSFSRDDAIAFATRLPKDGIELFEQPCGSDAWDDNAAVADRSTVPVMLDESIYGVDDIDRAARIPGVGFVKLKLKKVGSPKMLCEGLQRIRDRGMVPVLGDGTALELACWMEACIAARVVDNAGEMNGFLKPQQRLFRHPLPFEDGAIVLKAGWRPEVDHEKLAAFTRDTQEFGTR